MKKLTLSSQKHVYGVLHVVLFVLSQILQFFLSSICLSFVSAVEEEEVLSEAEAAAQTDGGRGKDEGEAEGGVQGKGGRHLPRRVPAIIPHLQPHLLACLPHGVFDSHLH
jgi:hypothetical protein